MHIAGVYLWYCIILIYLGSRFNLNECCFVQLGFDYFQKLAQFTCLTRVVIWDECWIWRIRGYVTYLNVYLMILVLFSDWATKLKSIQDSIPMMNASNIIVLIHWLVLTAGSRSKLIKEKHINAGLMAVPEYLNNNVEELILSKNQIHNITRSSLANYRNLIKLDMNSNNLIYIYDGSFYHNPKLQILILKGNALRYVSANFGPAQNSMVDINFWNAMEIALVNLNFSRFSSLKKLNLGSNPAIKIYDGSNLPKNLDIFFLHFGELEVMPNFALYTPNITTIKVPSNDIYNIPDEFVLGLKHLQTFLVGGNKLETIPDLYDCPLISLRLSDNPLICNQSFCWVRLWAKTKPTPLSQLDDAVCNSTSYFGGQNLLDVDPVKMECYKGGCDLRYRWLQYLQCVSNATTMSVKYDYLSMSQLQTISLDLSWS